MGTSNPEIIERIRYLSLVARRMGESPLLATPRRTLPAGGTEVTGFRDYSPGDNFSHVHWTWVARHDELLVKIFEGTADRYVHLLVDCSPGMAMGKPPKFELARQVAAALGYVALMNMDRMDVATFADGLVATLPTLRHPSRLPQLLRFLDRLAPSGTGTDLGRAAEMFVRRYRRPGPVVVISDLYNPDDFRRPLDFLRFHGYDPRLVHLVNPRDTDWDLLGDMELLDVETQTVRQATITERAARRYRELVAEFHESVRDYCSRRAMVYMPLACDMAADDVILRVLGGTRSGSPVQPRPAASVL